jgi:zinc protease
MGFGTAPASDADFWPLQVLMSLNQSSGGRIYEAIRGKRGLAYTVHPLNIAYLRAGAFVVYFASVPGAAAEAKRILRNEFAKLSSHPPAEEELEQAINYHLARRVVFSRTGLNQATRWGAAEASGVGLDWERNYEKKIRQVTTEQLRDVVRKYFRHERLLCVTLKGRG